MTYDGSRVARSGLRTPLPTFASDRSFGHRTSYFACLVGNVFLSVASFLAFKLKGADNTYFVLISIALAAMAAFAVGSFFVASLFPGISLLRMDTAGVTVQNVFTVRRLPWSSVASIVEKYYSANGRSGSWGILVRPRTGAGVRELFIPDSYRIGRSALMRTMQRLWIEANSRANHP